MRHCRLFLSTIMILPFLLLQSCTLFKSPPTITPTPQKIKKATIQYQMPPKQPLSTIEWDFPRTAKQLSILNNKKCLSLLGNKHEIDPNGVFDIDSPVVKKVGIKCTIPAVDNGSNLYIGLTEANYRSLVNNYNILILREEQWVKLLHQINLQFKLMNTPEE